MALVDDLLDLTRLENPPESPQQGPSLANVVDDVLAALGARAARQSVRLRAAASAGHVRADRRRLVQALEQLAGDSLRRLRGGGTIEIGSLQAGTEVMLFVRDDGPGYTAVERMTLFEPFVRHSAQGAGDAAADAGTGLGLALAARLAQVMGGRLGIEASPSGGAEFQLWLSAGIPAAAAPAPAPGAPSLTVLCVEDNPVNLLLVRELLALRPHVTLHEAEDGASGIERALEARPDVVLLDLQLPDVDGIEVMKRLRREPAMEGSIYVALSANAMPDQIAAARAAGFDDYWTKPIDFASFLAAIDRLAYGASRSRNQAPSSVMR